MEAYRRLEKWVVYPECIRMLNGMEPILVRSSCPNPIAAGPNRACGRIAKTMAPALLHFLNP